MIDVVNHRSFQRVNIDRLDIKVHCSVWVPLPCLAILTRGIGLRRRYAREGRHRLLQIAPANNDVHNHRLLALSIPASR